MKWLAILNPTTQNGAGLDHLRSLAGMLQRQLGAECAWSEYPGHACEIARGSAGFDGCIAVGGDGTIYEAVNGMDRKRQCLGIVPAGTGNGLAHELGLRDIPTALEVLRRPRPALLDLILVRYRVSSSWDERHVVHTSALGYQAGLVELGNGPLRRFGLLRYPAAACWQAIRQHELSAWMRIDDRPGQEVKLTNLVVNNTRYAGNFCVFPGARVQDGRLNILYARIPPQHQLLEYLNVLTQTYYLERSYRTLGQSVEVDLARPTELMLDGEIIPNVSAVRFQVVPGGLRCAAGHAPGIRRMEEPRDRPSRTAAATRGLGLARY